MKRLVILWLFLFSAVAPAQDTLEIKGDTVTVKVDRVVVVKEDLLLVRSLPFEVKAPPGGFGYVWTTPAGWVTSKKANVLEVKTAPKGAVTVGVEWYVVDFDKRVVQNKFASVTFAVGDVPPGPKPDPDPPIPAPTGARVLLVNESSAVMSKGQLNVWNSTELKAYLDRKCVKGDDGRPEWRKWDKDVSLTKETPTLVKLWDATKPQLKALPAIVIVTDGSGEIFPLPETIAETLTLLKSKLGD